MKRTRTPISVLCAAGTAMAVSLAHGEGSDPFRDADVVDLIGAARLADEAGDASLQTALTETNRERALMAIRAAPFAAAPEGLVPALLPHACGRDPVLAPEAAAALSALAERLSPSELSSREALLADVRAASTATQHALSESKSLRPDIQQALGACAAAFAALDGQLSAR